MPRYIDAEQFRGKHEVAEINGKLCSVIPYADIVYAPAADVVPRAEVAREIFEEIEDYIDRKLALLIGVIEDGEVMLAFKALLVVQDYLVELKKKYTEGKT
jgi:hypothetical protein